jgi:hypothetical protein
MEVGAVAANAEVAHRALDGMRFVYRSGSADLSHPGMSVAKVTVNGVLRGFTSGPLRAGALLAERLGVTFDQELTTQGGRLRIGQVIQRDEAGRATDRLVLAVWDGREYSVFTHLYDGGHVEALALVNAVRITERADGIVITPREEARAAFDDAARSVKWIPGLGTVEAARLDAKRVKALPSWQGAQVPAGELFRDSLGNGTSYLVLATSTAVVTVVPRPEVAMTDAIKLVGDLSIQATA